MSAIKDCKYVYYVEACDYEACWPVKFFSTEKAAEDYKEELNKCLASQIGIRCGLSQQKYMIEGE